MSADTAGSADPSDHSVGPTWREPGVGAPRAGRRRRRHDRGPRGPLAWPPVPAMHSRADLFDSLVVDAATRIERRWKGAFPKFELAVEDVPPSDPAPWEVPEVPLGRLFAAHGRAPARIVIYRRPVTTRAHGDADLAALVTEVVTEQVAALLGVQPGDLDPRWDEG